MITVDERVYRSEISISGLVNADAVHNRITVVKGRFVTEANSGLITYDAAKEDSKFAR